MLGNTWYYRVVAASPVNSVSTGPLFPSFVVCLVSTISIAWQTLTHGPQARRWHVETSSKWCEGCGLQDTQTIGKLKPVLYDAMGRKPRYSYMWNCHLTYEKHHIDPNGLRSNSIASQFRRSIPLDPPTCSQLFMHALRTWLFKFDGYGPVLLLAVECLTFIGINSKSMYSLMMERWRRWKVMVSGVVCRLWLLRPNRTSSLSREKWGSCVARPNIIW